MNNIDQLRAVLFETIEGLRNKEKPMEIERAKAINETAQVIINSAKAEIDFLKQSASATASGFFPTLPKPDVGMTPTGVKQTSMVPGGTVTTHKLRG